MEFLIQNWLPLLIVIAIIAYIIYLIITKQWTKIRELAYQMMLFAECVFSDEDGKLKFEFVSGIVYSYLPKWIKIFIKEEQIRKYIQEWYEITKDYLDDGVINDSIKRLKVK